MPPELQAETSPEDVLMAAVLGPDADEVDAPGAAAKAAGADVDDEPAIDAPDEVDEREPETKAEAKAETKEQDEEDYVEVAPTEDGGEPVRIKVTDLVASHQAYEKLRGQEAQIIERAEQEAVKQATARLNEVERVANQTATHIQAAMQLLQRPQPPNAELMLNPQSPHYDPDAYHRAYAGYQRAMGDFEQAKGVAGLLMQRAQDAAAAAAETREAAELNKLKRVWPEFSQAETLDTFIAEMGKTYGYTQDELDASMNDHRNALVARDALAYRKLMAKSGDVKKAVETKKPTLVRSKQEAKGTAQQARDTGGKFVSGTLAQAKKIGTDDAWAQHFAALSKAGRF